MGFFGCEVVDRTDQVFPRRKEYVPLVVAVHERQLQPVDDRQEVGVDRRPAPDEDVLGIGHGREGVVDREEDLGEVGSLEFAMRRDDQVSPSLQRPAELVHERFERAAAHEQGMSEGHCLEPAQVCGNTPGQVQAAPDDPVLGRDRRNEDQFAHVDAPSMDIPPSFIRPPGP